ncbi:ECU11_0525 [Encephalitozoon cuniculi GB-M1]|uniref:ECU11_0525 protein n=1 Tax=Encephalitozoon cuniculi (strain GB-M1) TaxID=284813 RepID=A0A1T5PD69_ENCCU|nr:uncharacterized protein ECU11_0525 [Encephalitozoon cuniculi GB-M1]UYI26252.1 hypothetical protein J0A71_01g00690 [Encephalitozoon cuniculi]SKD10710.1 ECU11_0525 [Encephalitozoon cuniculi GB-M1]
MGVRESFINVRRSCGPSEDPDNDDHEEEYYKWRIRDLKRKIRDIKKEIAKAKNIGDTDPRIY